MNPIRKGQGVSLACTLLAVTMIPAVGGLQAQTVPEPSHPAQWQVRTLYLKNITDDHDASEVITALRNILDAHDRIYLVGSQNAVVIDAPPEEIDRAQKLIAELDRPRRNYRLTYTITELEGGKRVGSRHVAVVVAAGQRSTLRQGNKVPAITGTFDSGKSAVESQATYIDVGLNLSATLDEISSGLKLRTKVERSAVAEEKSAVAPVDPIIRQAVLEGTCALVAGKPLVLGSLDLPDSAQQLQIEVVAEPVS